MCDACDAQRAEVIDFDVDGLIRECVEMQPSLHELLYNSYRTRLLDLRNRAMSSQENVHKDFFATVNDIERIAEDPSSAVVAEDPAPEPAPEYSFAAVMEEGLTEPTSRVTPMDSEEVARLFKS